MQDKVWHLTLSKQHLDYTNYNTIHHQIFAKLHFFCVSWYFLFSPSRPACLHFLVTWHFLIRGHKRSVEKQDCFVICVDSAVFLNQGSLLPKCCKNKKCLWPKKDPGKKQDPEKFCLWTNHAIVSLSLFKIGKISSL